MSVHSQSGWFPAVWIMEESSAPSQVLTVASAVGASCYARASMVAWSTMLGSRPDELIRPNML